MKFWIAWFDRDPSLEDVYTSWHHDNVSNIEFEEVEFPEWNDMYVYAETQCELTQRSYVFDEVGGHIHDVWGWHYES